MLSAPTTRVTHPQGGVVLWLELAPKVDSVELFFRAGEQGIAIAPGAIFSTGDKFSNYIRLSCGEPVTDRIRQGLADLGAMAAEMAG